MNPPIRFALLLALSLAPARAFAQAQPDPYAEAEEAQPAKATAPAAHAAVGSPAQKLMSDQLRKKGNELMADLKYDEALRAYDEAYAADPNPALLYNRGRALQALNRLPEAEDALEAFAKTAPPAIRAKVPDLDGLLAELRGKVSALAVDSNVPGARVIVRGEVVGETPLRARVNAGPAVVEVSRDGYDGWRQEVALAGGKETALTAKLAPKSKTGVLAIASKTPGARIFVDGKEAGASPAEMKLPAGSHGVRVSAKGYVDRDMTVIVEVGGMRRVDLALTPVYRTWWFWTAVGGGAAVLTAAIATAAALSPRPHTAGDISPGVVSSALVSW